MSSLTTGSLWLIPTTSSRPRTKYVWNEPNPFSVGLGNLVFFGVTGSWDEYTNSVFISDRQGTVSEQKSIFVNALCIRSLWLYTWNLGQEHEQIQDKERPSTRQSKAYKAIYLFLNRKGNGRKEKKIQERKNKICIKAQSWKLSQMLGVQTQQFNCFKRKQRIT